MLACSLTHMHILARRLACAYARIHTRAYTHARVCARTQVINLRSIKPLDRKTIVDSVTKTGR